MDSDIISSNPVAKVTETHHYDDTTGISYLDTVQDVTEIVEANKALHNLVDERTPWGGGRRVASIPVTVWEELRKRGITNDPKKFRMWLNDPDNRYFRTAPGKV